MRYALALVTAALCAGTAFADEPAACYVQKDPTGDFVAEKVHAFDADQRIGAQVERLLTLPRSEARP